MTPPAPVVPATLNFKRTASLLDGGADVGVEVSAIRDPAIAAAMLADTPFPAGECDLASISLRGEAGRDITFGSGSGTVRFSGAAGVHGGVAVFDSAASLVNMIRQAGLADQVVSTLRLPDEPGVRYMAMVWGYDVAGRAGGAVGLGPSITFGVEGARKAFHSVIRRFEAQSGARTVLGATVASWTLPRQVRSVDGLPPGTILVTEVDGSVAVRLGAKDGYDFSWVREAATLGGLSGDIGLQLQLQASATFGFHAEGGTRWSSRASRATRRIGRCASSSSSVVPRGGTSHSRPP